MKPHAGRNTSLPQDHSRIHCHTGMLRPLGQARAGNCMSWHPDPVTLSLDTLAHHPTIPVLQGGGPNEEGLKPEAQLYAV